MGISEGAWAQAANPFAPTGAMDTLNAGSPSGGLNSSTYIGRANAAAGAANNPFGAPAGGPAYAPPPAPGMYPGMAFPGMAYPAPGAYPGQPGLAQPTPTQGPPPVTVITGERIYSHLQFGAYPPELLQDAEKIKVPNIVKELQKQYFDDGTHGDAKANDNQWTYITQRNDVMSPEEFRILNRIIAALTSSEDTNPRDFFRLPVATTEPLSNLPQLMDLEKRRDDKIGEWNKRVLAEFRQNKEEVSSQFWPVFVPPPPTAPRMEIPPGFNPTVEQGGTNQPGQLPFPGMAYPGAGPMGMEPGVGPASSSYGFNVK